MKLEVRDLAIAFDAHQVLKQINFKVKDGEFVSLIGASGCGKSTLFNALAGILSPQAGSIYVDGEAVQGISAHFAYMPQNDLLLPWKTILDNVTLYARIHHHLKEAKTKAMQEMAVFGLQGYEHSYPDELSGGMRQRAAFLRTALCGAKIMLLDEPFGALDVITRNEMQDWLLKLRNEMNKTALLVTHDIDEALYLSDRIFILGERPATIIKEIDVSKCEKTRDWLFQQGALRKEIFTILQEQVHAA